VSALESLISDLREVCAGLPDRRQGPREKCLYAMADIGLSAFSLFFMGSPSFLAHQRVLAQGHGRSNCQTLFGMAAIPSDNYIRAMLDGAEPTAFDGLFYDALATLAAGDCAGALPARRRTAAGRTGRDRVLRLAQDPLRMLLHAAALGRRHGIFP